MRQLHQKCFVIGCVTELMYGYAQIHLTNNFDQANLTNEADTIA
jgi:hypothetical protein